MVDHLIAPVRRTRDPQISTPKFRTVLAERLALLAAYFLKRSAGLCFLAGDIDRNGLLGLAADRIGVCAHEKAHALAARVLKDWEARQ
jgi:hypothetical protein